MTTTHPQVRAASFAVFAVFVLNGANFSSWAARLPAVRDGLDLQPAQMGLLLLIGSLGSIVALPLSGLIVTRLGAARTVLTFALVNACGYLLAALGVGLGQVPVVAAALVLCGIGTGVWDASMNLEGALVEQRLGRTVMPRYHAGFSVGTVAAAGIAALAAAARVPVWIHLPLVVLVTTVGVFFAVRKFLPVDHAETGTVAADGPKQSVFAAWLEPRTLLIGLVVLAAALTEGAGNDWLSLAVVDGFAQSDTVGAVSFGIFVAAMTAMRFLGTGLLDRFGRVVVLRLCAGLALVGLLIFGLVPTDMLWLAVIGAVLWGMGAALGFPVGMSAASDDPLRAAARVSVVSTIGYTAFLAGPPLLGLLADHVGYRHALLVIAAPIVIGLLVVKVAAPPVTAKTPTVGA
ncbi:MFS transporter [Cellulomonas taurus]|uniref:MFS transporter n=1 Tax=Cellulomonas taurus TaxID=2729175 RepID=UPI00145C4021|nr:MFS transporter [Cellulomonas taurus]